MTLLLYSRSVPDAIASALVKETRPDVRLVALEDVIAQSEIKLRANGGYEFEAADHISAIADSELIINRALISKDTLSSYTLNERPSPLALQTEVESAVGAAITAARDATARPGLYSLCGDNLPLYLQWQCVHNAFLDFSIPDYAYAFGSLAPEVASFRRVVYKSAYDFKTWRPNEPPATWWHTFAVDRPAGTPVVASVVGNGVVVMGDIDVQQSSRICEASPVIARLFGSDFGEILYFINGTELYFGAFTHHVTGRGAGDQINALVEEWMTEKLRLKS